MSKFEDRLDVTIHISSCKHICYSHCMMPVMCGDHIVVGGFSSSGVLSGGVGGARGDETEQISDGCNSHILFK